MVGAGFGIGCGEKLITKKNGIRSGEKTERLSRFAELESAGTETNPSTWHQDSRNGNHSNEIFPAN